MKEDEKTKRMKEMVDQANQEREDLKVTSQQLVHKLTSIEKTLQETLAKFKVVEANNELAREKIKKYSHTHKAEIESLHGFRTGFEQQIQQINITLQALNTRDYL